MVPSLVWAYHPTTALASLTSLSFNNATICAFSLFGGYTRLYSVQGNLFPLNVFAGAFRGLLSYYQIIDQVIMA